MRGGGEPGNEAMCVLRDVMMVFCLQEYYLNERTSHTLVVACAMSPSILFV